MIREPPLALLARLPSFLLSPVPLAHGVYTESRLPACGVAGHSNTTPVPVVAHPPVLSSAAQPTAMAASEPYSSCNDSFAIYATTRLQPTQHHVHTRLSLPLRVLLCSVAAAETTTPLKPLSIAAELLVDPHPWERSPSRSCCTACRCSGPWEMAAAARKPTAAARCSRSSR